MAEVAAMKENEFWSKVHAADQKPPDSRARVRFLLDEIALLQARSENKEPSKRRPDSKTKIQSSLAELKATGQVPPVIITRKDDIIFSQAVTSQEKDESTQTSDVHLQCVSRLQSFAKVAEETLQFLIESRNKFYSEVETETKPDPQQLVKLLEIEKPNLQNHKSKVDELSKHYSITCFEGSGSEKGHNFDLVTEMVASDFCVTAQAMIERLRRLLKERKVYHSRLNMEIESGNLFRLLKLLETGKVKHEASKKELQSMMQTLNEVLKKGTVVQSVDHTNVRRREGTEEGASSSPSSLALPSSSLSLSSSSTSVVRTDYVRSPSSICSCSNHEEIVDSDLQVDNEVVAEEGKVQSFKEFKKAAKDELLKLVCTQEEKWKKREKVVEELQRRLAIMEVEKNRLGNIRDSQTITSAWTENLPKGYSTIYFSPIFHDRKSANEQDKKDGQLLKLRAEINDLKNQLRHKDQQRRLSGSGESSSTTDESQDPFDRSYLSVEEKTIPMDVTSRGSGKIPYAFDESEFVRTQQELDHSSLTYGEREFLKMAVEKFCLICEQHKNELERCGSESMKDLSLETLKILNLEINAMMVSYDLQRDSNNKKSTEELERGLKCMAEVLDANKEELDRKEKTLLYAQELNMRLANDMLKTENALTELRAEHKAVTESKLKEVEDRIEILEKMLQEKDQVLQEAQKRIDILENQNDASVSEKKELLIKLDKLKKEMELQETQVSQLQDANNRYQIRLQDNDMQREELEKEVRRVKGELEKESKDKEGIKARYSFVQSRVLESEYELTQREEALERLTLHLASTMESQRIYSEESMESIESLRSIHCSSSSASRDRSKIVQDLESKLESMAREMSKAKAEMAEMKKNSIFARPSQNTTSASRWTLQRLEKQMADKEETISFLKDSFQ